MKKLYRTQLKDIEHNANNLVGDYTIYKNEANEYNKTIEKEIKNAEEYKDQRHSYINSRISNWFKFTAQSIKYRWEKWFPDYATMKEPELELLDTNRPLNYGSLNTKEKKEIDKKIEKNIKENKKRVKDHNEILSKIEIAKTEATRKYAQQIDKQNKLEELAREREKEKQQIKQEKQNALEEKAKIKEQKYLNSIKNDPVKLKEYNDKKKQEEERLKAEQKRLVEEANRKKIEDRNKKKQMRSEYVDLKNLNKSRKFDETLKVTEQMLNQARFEDQDTSFVKKDDSISSWISSTYSKIHSQKLNIKETKNGKYADENDKVYDKTNEKIKNDLLSLYKAANVLNSKRSVASKMFNWAESYRINKAINRIKEELTKEDDFGELSKQDFTKDEFKKVSKFLLSDKKSKYNNFININSNGKIIKKGNGLIAYDDIIENEADIPVDKYGNKYQYTLDKKLDEESEKLVDRLSEEFDKSEEIAFETLEKFGKDIKRNKETNQLAVDENGNEMEIY